MSIGLRGARPSPRHRLAGATPFKPTATIPAEFATIPNALRYWGNDEYGVCVTTEEAFNIAAFSQGLGIPEVCLSNTQVIDWARKHGFLNGAYLAEVMDALQVAEKSGILGDAGSYFDGPPLAVDWENRTALCGAIYNSKAAVKIGIAADCLGDEPQGKNGWYVLTCKKDRNLDHCVPLCGYGSIAFIFKAMNLPTPTAVDPTTFGYAMFTWNGIGFVAEDALHKMTGEAWLRSPSSIQQPPYDTPPPPPPPPNPCQWLIDLLTTTRPRDRSRRLIPETLDALAQAAREWQNTAKNLNTILDTAKRTLTRK